ncbi:MAG: hypothetical protein OEY22_05770 [Candidatus Bathyarchaeota archaeon]|nr:hypothetical protein [Candidatus Bathyarchaeota archaeon]MDH5788623.1 hypothetical protein [Candidatus Bathyarchaeota archaeon]
MRARKRARELEYFTLDICLCKVIKFQVEPQSFEVGQEVNISLRIRNTGSRDLTGTCILKVQETECIVQEFTHDFSALAPGNNLTFSSAWNTSAAKKGVV